MNYSIYPHTLVSAIPKDADSIHLVRPIPAKKLRAILKKTGTKLITISESCQGRLSGNERKAIREAGAELKVRPRRGRAVELPLSKVREIVELHRDERSYREIEKLARVPKSTAHYLIKYSNRNKLRQGKRTVNLD
ncbi:MAG: hypothetical protein ABID38_02200 [Candidatus Diapherotrites archaeon]